MSTDFWIQVGRPRWHKSVETGLTTIDEAVESVFPRETEDAFIVWRGIYIPISYKYDVGTIFPDILEMMHQILAVDAGSWCVDWPSNTFSARWVFEWENERLVVRSEEWRAVVGDTEELLRARSTIRVNRMEFLVEWRMLLDTVAFALREAGFRDESLPELSRFYSLSGRIIGSGVLYR